MTRCSIRSRTPKLGQAEHSRPPPLAGEHADPPTETTGEVDHIDDPRDNLDRLAVVSFVIGVKPFHGRVECRFGGHRGKALPLGGAKGRLDLGVGRGPRNPGGNGVAIRLEDVG